MRKLFALVLIALSTACAAQTSPGLYYGQVPTAAQWNTLFASKMDYTPGGIPITAGGTGAANAAAARSNLGALGISALPSATTSQLYGGTGTAGTASVITLGTGLSMAGGVLNASGGSGGAPNYNSFTATASQTLFTLSYTYTTGSHYLQVFQNGVKLGTSDFTETSTGSFTLTTGAATGDFIEALVYGGPGAAGTAGPAGAAGPAGPSGPSGSISTISVVSAHGLAGTVANPTTTPAITLSTSITGMLKGDGTNISAGTAGTDYSVGTAALATGILKSTTGTGALTRAVNSDLPVMTATVGGAVPTPPNNTTTFLRGDGTFAAPASGSGSVTNVSVSTANGFAGTVTNPTTTPAISLTTSVTGVLKGNGTAISTATAGTDYPGLGSNNTFTGLNAFTGNDLMVKNMTVGLGGAAVTTNTAVGTSALPVNTSGVHNTAIGASALLVNTTGYGNTAVGEGAGASITSGIQNTTIGQWASSALSTGSNNVTLGNQANTLSATDNNSIVIGSNASGLGTNTTVIGTSATTKTELYGLLLLPTAGTPTAGYVLTSDSAGNGTWQAGGGGVSLSVANTWTAHQSITYSTAVSDEGGVIGTVTLTSGSGMQHVVGGSFHGIVFNGGDKGGWTDPSAAYGIATEAWSGNKSSAPTAPSILSNEVSIISQYDSNPTAVNIKTMGLNIVYKDRADDAATPILGLGNNAYNANSAAIWVSGQPSGTSGERVGFNGGLVFDTYSIGAAQPYLGSLTPAVAIDVHSINQPTQSTMALFNFNSFGATYSGLVENSSPGTCSKRVRVFIDGGGPYYMPVCS